MLDRCVNLYVEKIPNRTPSFAHAPGLPPFLRIDGKYTTQYVISSSAITGLVLPQDSAPVTTSSTTRNGCGITSEE